MSCEWDNSKNVVPGNSKSKPDQTGSDGKCFLFGVFNSNKLLKCHAIDVYALVTYRVFYAKH